MTPPTDLIYPHSLHAARVLDPEEQALLSLGKRRLLLRTIAFILAYPIAFVGLSTVCSSAFALVRIHVPPLYTIFLAAPLAAMIAVAVTRELAPGLAAAVEQDRGLEPGALDLARFVID